MEDKALLSTEEASGVEKAELLIVIPAYNEAENIEGCEPSDCQFSAV